MNRIKLTREDFQRTMDGVLIRYNSNIIKQILEDQELANERREQLRLENSPNIEKFTYDYYDLKRLPEYKEDADKWRNLMVHTKYHNYFGCNYHFELVKEQRRNQYLQSELQQLKEKIKQNEELREKIVDLADIWDGKESMKYGKRLGRILKECNIHDVPRFYTDGSIDKITEEILDDIHGKKYVEKVKQIEEQPKEKDIDSAKRTIDDILKESLPNESLFATANKKYDPEKDRPIIYDELVFGDKDWALDSIHQLKQENKKLKEKIEEIKKLAEDEDKWISGNVKCDCYLEQVQDDLRKIIGEEK